MVDLDPAYLFDHSPYQRFVLKEEGDRFVFVKTNLRFLEKNEVEEKDVLNKPFTMIEWLSIDGNLYNGLLRCQETGQPQTIEIKRQLCDGASFYTLGVSRIPHETEVLYNVIAFVNPTTYSTLKQERDDAQILFNSIFQTSDAGIIVIDHHRLIVSVNNSFLRDFGWSAKNLVGKDFTMLFSDEQKELAKSQHEKAIVGETDDIWDTFILRGDSGIADVLAGSAMMEMSQRRRFHMMSFIDISEQKNIAENLRQIKEEAVAANKAKSDFLANMSHELRTPLNAILGFSEMIMNEIFGSLGNDRYKEYLEDVHMSARHLLAIINDVLDMSKIEAGRLELDERIVDISSMVHTLKRMMEAKIISRNLNFKVAVANDVPMLKGDERLLRQIMMNLISNAIKFTPEGKNIYFSVDLTENGDVRFVVKDEGIGIPPDQVDVVLEPFGQVADPTHNVGQGTGLGLPLAKAMTEIHGGNLSLFSTKDEGTEVICIFPKSRIIEGAGGVI